MIRFAAIEHNRARVRRKHELKRIVLYINPATSDRHSSDAASHFGQRHGADVRPDGAERGPQMSGDDKGVHEIWKIQKLNEADVGCVGGPDILKAW